MLAEGEYYLVQVDNKLRFARFEGFGKAWGGRDWSGDTGLPTDSWMHSDIEGYVACKRLSFRIKGSEIVDITIDN